MALMVEDLGKRYWLRQGGPVTFQETLTNAFLRVRSTPFWALRNVSFQIAPGESVGVVGSNGAGKTTLLRLVCGLGRPTKGHVRVTGRVAALLTLGAGFHPQLTGRENLYVSAVVSGLRRREVKQLYDSIVEFAELQDFIDQPFRTYSSGMQMRLGFSVAIHVDPAVLIIDEALSVGDAHFQQKCLGKIEGFRRGGKTLFIVSHDMTVIRTFCTRALWLKRGALIADGPAETVASQYQEASEQETLSASRGGA